MAALFLDDGSYWLVIADHENEQQNQQSRLNIIQGLMNRNGALVSERSQDITDSIVKNLVINGSVLPKTSMKLNVLYENGTHLAADLNYDDSYDYDKKPNLGLIAGSYSGKIQTHQGVEPISFDISQTGEIKSKNPLVCQFSGNAKVRPNGNLYSMDVEISNGQCQTNQRSIKAIAVYDKEEKEIVAIAENGRESGFILSATKF
ncbi:hypothetical protein WAE56_16135 [Iodobacter sp. LRB]|uniref:hypothetical protein n=1 Tax=unclassified Iodobacter TaxID=235634 RepID=UPI00117A8C77|nr:hypothetical protein [Iodobacter sp. BJB302]